MEQLLHVELRHSKAFNRVDQTVADLQRSFDKLELIISDGVAVLQFLFLGVPVGCQDAADSNDSGDVDLTDAVFTFNFLFLGGDPPPPPTGECGEDEAADLLPDCTTPDSCI
ncbi:MAG: hypothetical protein AAF488_15450 [Planctomycetota bacterium]